MLDHSEVPLAEPGKAGAVDLGVAADDVVHPGMEFASGSVEPLFRRLVPAVNEHRLRGPVLLLPRQPLAPLQYEDIDAPPRKRECGRAAAHPGADDDHFCAQRPHPVIQTWPLREHGSGTGSLEPSPSAEVLMSRGGAGAKRSGRTTDRNSRLEMSGLARLLRWSRAGLAVGLGALVLQLFGADAASPAVIKAELDGDINTLTDSYIEQVVKRAELARAEAVVLVMNTPGGDSQSMDAIVTTLLNSRVPVIAFVYPAGARADSAGLFVAQAADLVAMAPGSNTGSAHPIQAGGGDLTGDLGKKVLHDAVARVRYLATVHGRNADWCERAVQIGR